MILSSKVAVAWIAGVLSLAGPVLLSVYLARNLASDAEQGRVLAYARDIVRRSDDTALQIRDGAAMLLQADFDPCSQADISLMREIDLSSSYIQAIGRVVGSQLVCSSLGNSDLIPLGPIDYVGAAGAAVRSNVELPLAKGKNFAVIEWQGFAAVVHQALPIDLDVDSDTSLALFHPDSLTLLAQQGEIKPEWLDALHGNRAVSFTDSTHVVAVLRSDRFATAAVAAVPTAYLTARVNEFSMRFVPIGLLGGIGLALVVMYLARLQLSMRSVLRTALKRGEFFVEYQPMVDLRSRQWVGAEALIRWRRPTGELVRPDLFIPVAEDTDIITQITERVVQLVAADAPQILRKNADFHIGINLTAKDLQASHTAELLDWLTQHTGARSSNFLVEATERGFVADANAAREVLGSIRSRGIAVAIDDFGTGYSSLSYLEKFQLDFLKIDKSFVDTIGTDGATSQVVLHIIEMAHSLKLELIAEGVETEAQAQFLEKRGVRYAQGWLFGKPMPSADLTARIPATIQVPA